MTLIEYTNHEGNPDKFYINKALAKQLDGIHRIINKRDQDYVMCIDGAEGCGKSTLAAQIAKYVDPSFTHERMCLNPTEFIAAINNGKKGQCVVYDEAFMGLGSSSVLSPINKLLTGMMMEMRKKNLFVILVLPSFFYLSKYAALHRAQVLIHIYKQGGFIAYNKKKMSLLYLFGKRKMSYSYPKVYLYQDYTKKAPIDWKIYENRKIESLKHRGNEKEKEYSPKTIALFKKQGLQRDALIARIKKEQNLSNRELEKWFKDQQLDFSQVSIRESVKTFEKFKNLSNPEKFMEELEPIRAT